MLRLINKKRALYLHAAAVGYLAAKVMLVVLRQAVRILISGEIVVDSVKFFFHYSYSS